MKSVKEERARLRAEIKAQKAELRAVDEQIRLAMLEKELAELKHRAAYQRQVLCEMRGALPAEPEETPRTLGSMLRDAMDKTVSCRLGQDGYGSCEDCPCPSCREAVMGTPNVVAFRR